MHPAFSGLFIHPVAYKPLIFFGMIEDIPAYVISSDQAFPEEILKELKKVQGEVWVKKRWNNGFLWALGEHEMYHVIGGIPIFVLPPEQTWPPTAVRELQREEWMRKNWEHKRFEEKSIVTEFAKRMAESEGLILDIASGPGGGFVPLILHENPRARILMNDLGLGLLQEWKRFLKFRDIHDVSFVLFDARKMPLKSDSMDIVSEIWGFSEICGSIEAIREAYRILKPGGTLFSIDGVIDKADLFKLPKNIRMKWYNLDPHSFEGFLDAYKSVGFKVISHNFLVEREMSLKAGDLPREGDKYGVRLHAKIYCTEVIK